VSYSSNGYDYNNHTLLSFQYNYPPIAIRIDPERGSSEGHTHVRIIGQNFVNVLSDTTGGDVRCRFGEEEVSAQVNTETSVSCVVPPLPRVYEVQSLDVIQLPHAPLIYQVSAKTAADPVGDTYRVTTSVANLTSETRAIEFSVLKDEDEIQQISFVADNAPAPIGRLSIHNPGRVQEIQTISTTASYQPEIKALFIRAPYNQVQSEYQEVQKISITNSAATVTVRLGSHVANYLGTSSVSIVQSSLQTLGAYGSACTVTFASSPLTKTFDWTVTFSKAAGNVPLLSVQVSVGTSMVVVLSEGGVAEVQEVRLSFPPGVASPGGFIRLGFNNEFEFTPRIAFNASAKEIKASMEEVSQIGKVKVSTSYSVQSDQSAVYSWSITFLQLLGDLPLLMHQSFLSSSGQVEVIETVNGTTQAIRGNFSLSLNGRTTSPSLAHDSSSATIRDAVRSLSGVDDIDVDRYDLINSGVMILITFPDTAGDIDEISIDSSHLSATGLNTESTTYQEGQLVEGGFVLEYFQSTSILRSKIIPYNASSNDLARQLEEDLFPDFIPLTVSRSTNSIVNTYTWTITFPYHAGSVGLLQVNTASLLGFEVNGYSNRVQEGQIATVQKVSTAASSALSGYFYLSLEGRRTEPISCSASESEMKFRLEQLPNVGAVAVTRISTGFVDARTWQNAEVYASNLADAQSLFQYDVNSFDWFITFESRAGAVPLMTACCDELSETDLQQVTLRSAFSRDSSIVIQTTTLGTTSKLSGDIAVLIDGKRSSFFNYDANEIIVGNALYELGINEFTMSTLPPDVNGLVSYDITFTLDSDLDFLDKSVAFDLSVDTTYLFPTSSRPFITFDWLVPPPSHEIQFIAVVDTAVSLICSVTVKQQAVQIIVNAPLSTGKLNVAFKMQDESLGRVIVTQVDQKKMPASILSSITGSRIFWRLVFVDFVGYLPRISCNQADSYVYQKSLLSALNGTFSILRTDDSKLGTTLQTAALSLNATDVEIAEAIDRLYGAHGNEVTVSRLVDPFALNSSFFRSWLVTFSGPSVGGNVDLLSVLPTHSSNGKGEVVERRRGAQPTGTIQLTSHYAQVAAVDVSSDVETVTKVLQLLFPSLVSETSDDTTAAAMVVAVRGPDRVGTITWEYSFHLSKDLNTSLYAEALQQVRIRPLVLSQGSIPLTGSFRLSVTTHDGLTKSTVIPVDSTAVDVGHALQRLDSVVFQGVTVEKAMENSAGAASWSIALSSSTTTVDAMTVADIDLEGSGASVHIQRTSNRTVPLSGSFDLGIDHGSSNQQVVTIQTNATSNDLEQLFGEHQHDVTVRRPISSEYAVQWLLTFSSLRYAIQPPLLSLSPSHRTQAFAEVTVASTGGSLPVFNFTLPRSADGFRLLWRPSGREWHFNASSSAAIVQSTLELYEGFAYVKVENYTTANGGSDWLLLIVPLSVDGLDAIDLDLVSFGALSFDVDGDDREASPIPLLEPFYPLSPGGGSLSFSLDSIGCEEDAGGMLCRPSLPREESLATQMPPDPQQLKYSIESLRDVNHVLVSRSPLFGPSTEQHSAASAAGPPLFILQGFRYLITFTQLSRHSEGNAVTDLNYFSWNSYYGQIRFNPEPTVEVLNIPLLSAAVRSDDLSAGWQVAMQNVVQGRNVANETIVNVSVTLNGQEWSDQLLSYEYFQVPTVHRLVPSHGPKKGMTEIIVYGSGFIKSKRLSCLFGTGRDMITPVTYFINSTSFICLSPPALYDDLHSVVLRVSNNGYFTGGDMSTGDVLYSFDRDVAISSIVPPLGPVSGNFSVEVLGGPFVETDELRCKFGKIAVRAFFVNAGKIMCYAPPHPAGMYPMEVTLNDQDYTSLRRTFFFYADPALSRIYPPSGPAIAAGTIVNVFGTGFTNTTFLTCRFGGTKSVGLYVSSNYIQCPTPPLDLVASGGLKYSALSEQFNRYPDPAYAYLNLQGKNKLKLFPEAHGVPLYLQRLVTVEVSNNNQDFTHSGINFLYQYDAYVTSVSPNSGQVNAKIPIVVNGNNFVNSTLLRCRIGEYVSTPTFISTVAVLCFTPRIPLITFDHNYIRDRSTLNVNTPQARAADTSPFTAGPNVVFVEVSNNGQDYTNNKQTFTFNIKCSSGTYCPQLNEIPCPPGTFCPGEFNFNVRTS
jgi:hypothetical protein